MYQYEFFDKRAYTAHPAPMESVPSGFAKIDDVDLIRSSYWAEHCLECAEPLCYESCEHFSNRWDERCRRFEFGIYDSPHFSQFPYHSEVKFRKWGKVESIVYPGAMPVQEALDIDAEWKKRCKSKRRLMAAGAIGRFCYPIEKRRAFDSEKYRFSGTAGSPEAGSTPHFLLQLYSYEAEPFKMMFEITDDNELVFRAAVDVQAGYVQAVIDVADVFPGNGRLRTRIYPENDLEANVVFLFCEFVSFKSGVDVSNLRGYLTASAVAPTAAPAAVTASGSTQGKNSSSNSKTSQNSSSTQEKAQKPAKKVKCLAWDLDNTVWNGILMESDPDKLELREGVWEAMQALDERGIIQICLSKNDEADVLPVLERLNIKDMFVALYVNWNRKSSNMQAAADYININIDTFALVDDSAFERNEVASTLPMVRVYREDQIEEILTDPAFDVPVTAESKKRRKMYQTENLRKQAAAQSDDGELGFLRSCKIEGIVHQPSVDSEIKRAYELIQRTNQLNLSGNKYSENEFAELLSRETYDSYVAFCQDRFGSYGQILFMQVHYNEQSKHLVIDEFAMSCRVAGKFFESALMLGLAQRYGATGIEISGRKTERNGLLIRTFTGIGFEDLCNEEDISLQLRDLSKLSNPDIVSMRFE